MKTRRDSLSILLFTLLMVTLVGLPLVACTRAPTPTLTVTPTPTSPPGKPENITTSTPSSEFDMLSKVKPAVVEVVTDKERGSGVVIDKQGYVLTCNHVVEDSQSIKVLLFGGFGSLADRREFRATVLGRDEIRAGYIGQPLQIRMNFSSNYYHLNIFIFLSFI
jgi:S1-C subfamily serine protease